MSKPTTVTLMNPPIPGAVLLDDHDPSVSGLPGANRVSAVASRTLSSRSPSPISPERRDPPDDGKRHVRSYEAANGPAPALRHRTVHPLPPVAERTSKRRHTGTSLEDGHSPSSPNSPPKAGRRVTISPNTPDQPSHGNLARKSLTIETPKAVKDIAGRLGIETPPDLTINVPESPEEVQEAVGQAWVAARRMSKAAQNPGDVARTLRELSRNPAVARLLEAVAEDPELANVLTEIAADPEAAIKKLSNPVELLKKAHSVRKLVRSATEASLGPKELSRADRLEMHQLYNASAFVRLGTEILNMISRVLGMAAAGGIAAASFVVACFCFLGMIFIAPFSCCSSWAEEKTAVLEKTILACFDIFGESIKNIFIGFYHLCKGLIWDLPCEIVNVAVYFGVALPIGLGIVALSLVPLVLAGITSPLLCCTPSIPKGLWNITQKVAKLGVATICTAPRMGYEKCRTVLELIGIRTIANEVVQKHSPHGSLSLRGRLVQNYRASVGSTISSLVH